MKGTGESDSALLGGLALIVDTLEVQRLTQAALRSRFITSRLFKPAILTCLTGVVTTTIAHITGNGEAPTTVAIKFRGFLLGPDA